MSDFLSLLLSNCLFLHQSETISAGSTGFMALVTSKMANLNPSAVTPDEEVCLLAFVSRFLAVLFLLEYCLLTAQ